MYVFEQIGEGGGGNQFSITLVFFSSKNFFLKPRPQLVVSFKNSMLLYFPLIDVFHHRIPCRDMRGNFSNFETSNWALIYSFFGVGDGGGRTGWVFTCAWAAKTDPEECEDSVDAGVWESLHSLHVPECAHAWAADVREPVAVLLDFLKTNITYHNDTG